MQTTSAPMAWLFLQENVLPQWQQKIALRAENKHESKYVIKNAWGRRIFRT